MESSEPDVWVLAGRVAVILTIVLTSGTILTSVFRFYRKVEDKPTFFRRAIYWGGLAMPWLAFLFPREIAATTWLVGLSVFGISQLYLFFTVPLLRRTDFLHLVNVGFVSSTLVVAVAVNGLRDLDERIIGVIEGMAGGDSDRTDLIGRIIDDQKSLFDVSDRMTSVQTDLIHSVRQLSDEFIVLREVVLSAPSLEGIEPSFEQCSELELDSTERKKCFAEFIDAVRGELGSE